MTNETLRQQLQTIHTSKGRLDPADVVTEARNDTSPLHRFFTWDDTEAAEQYRLDQARALIRRVKIEIRTEPDADPIRVRGFVSVDTTGEDASRHYQPLTEVAGDDELRERVLDEARRDLRRLQAKYRHLGEAFTALAQQTLIKQDAA